MPFWDYLFYNEAQRTLKKGIALIKSKQYEEAIPLLDKVIRKNPGHFLYYYLRGAAWLNLGQSERGFHGLRNSVAPQSETRAGRVTIWV